MLEAQTAGHVLVAREINRPVEAMQMFTVSFLRR